MLMTAELSWSPASVVSPLECGKTIVAIERLLEAPSFSLCHFELFSLPFLNSDYQVLSWLPYFFLINLTFICSCAKCRTHTKKIRSCTPTSDTVCSCEPGYYEIMNGECSACRSCLPGNGVIQDCTAKTKRLCGPCIEVCWLYFVCRFVLVL